MRAIEFSPLPQMETSTSTPGTARDKKAACFFGSTVATPEQQTALQTFVQALINGASSIHIADLSKMSELPTDFQAFCDTPFKPSRLPTTDGWKWNNNGRCTHHIVCESVRVTLTKVSRRRIHPSLADAGRSRSAPKAWIISAVVGEATKKVNFLWAERGLSIKAAAKAVPAPYCEPVMYEHPAALPDTGAPRLPALASLVPVASPRLGYHPRVGQSPPVAMAPFQTTRHDPFLAHSSFW